MGITSSFKRCAFGIVVAAFTACAGTQLQSVAPNLIPQGPAVATRADIVPDAETGRSWMLPEAKREDLIYTSDVNLDKVFVLSLRTGKLVGELSFSDLPWGLCNDNAGHIFVTHFRLHDAPGAITQFAHGDPRPIATRSLPDGESGACTVDAANGDLAVTVGAEHRSNTVSIFSPPLKKETPPRVIDAPSTLDAVLYCAYDSHGNLFLTPVAFSTGPTLIELPFGSSKLITINLSGYRFGGGPLQWQGPYLATSIPTVERVTVSGLTGKVVGTTQLKLVNHKDFGDNQFWIQGGKIVAPFSCPTVHCSIPGDKVGVWTYPNGSLVKVFHSFGASGLSGITVSHAPE